MMKNIFPALTLLFALLPSYSFAQDGAMLRKARVDKRVELMSVVFRLAERPEYNSRMEKAYTDRIDKWYEHYRDHETVRYAKSLVNDHHIRYDAPISLAVHLDDELNLLKNKTEANLVRWRPEVINEFLPLLKKFALDTDFEGFFASNADLYAEAERRFTIDEKIDTEWFLSFFGQQPREEFTILLGPGNGDNCYGPAVEDTDGRRTVYSIMGTWHVDDIGMPVYQDDFLWVIVHEFSHSFVNPINFKHMDLLRDSGERLMESTYNTMISQGYGEGATVLNEALVRACVIKYLQDHGLPTEEQFEFEEKQCGFVWIRPLVDELNKYDSQRDIYPSLESYIPVIAAAYDDYAVSLPDIAENRPKVVSISEFGNGDTAVSVNVKSITINFDRPLIGGRSFSIFTGDKGIEAFPETHGVRYDNDNRSVVMTVELKKGHEYQMILKGFRSDEGIRMEPYEVNFITAE